VYEKAIRKEFDRRGIDCRLNNNFVVCNIPNDKPLPTLRIVFSDHTTYTIDPSFLIEYVPSNNL
jgi:hypothetical protein